MSNVVIRELEGPEEFGLIPPVACAAWRMTTAEVSPPADLIALTHAGALTAGAFRGRGLVGFVHGYPRANLGQPALHSHFLAVVPSEQGQGLSTLLKLYQRDWCRRRGIGLVTWTYDPLLVKNARLNLVRLGAEARNYLPNFYGAMGGIYGGLATDRFEVFWDLDSPRAAAAARGETLLERDLSGARRIPLSRSSVPSGRLPSRLAIEISLDGARLLRSDPPAARRHRRRLRQIAAPLMARGYAATSVAIEGGAAVYLLERT
jgi:chorismate synthase